MNPSIVIGVGGTGKWVVTHLKRLMLDTHQRALLREHGESARERVEFVTLPAAVQLFAVDVDAERQPTLEDPRYGTFHIDHREGSPEFIPLGASVRAVLETIQRGEGERDFQYITSWLRKSDADCYDAAKLAETTDGGAGQFRQLGRMSLFLRLGEETTLVDRIRSACATVAEATEGDRKVNVFITGSVGGGTGSGALFDVAALARSYAATAFGGNQQVIGYLALPTTFVNVVESSSDELMRLQANSYAALRELVRLTISPKGAAFRWTDHLHYQLTDPLFDVTYLIEGSRGGEGPDLSGKAPRDGVAPAIADAIFLHTAHPLDYAALRTDMMAAQEGAYSTFGVVRHILPVEEMILEFGHRLARGVLDYLRWGQRIDRDGEVDAALAAAVSGAAAQQALAMRSAVLENADSRNSNILRRARTWVELSNPPQLKTPLMSGYLQVNDPQVDTRLPDLTDLPERVPIASFGQKGEPATVRRLCMRLLNERLGGPDDSLNRKQPTVAGVLNHYREAHIERFRSYLGAELLNALNESTGEEAARPRAAGLELGRQLLDALEQYLREYASNLKDEYRRQNLRDVGGESKTQLEIKREELAVAEEAMLRDDGFRDAFNNRGEQETYLQLVAEVFELEKQDRIFAALTEIIEQFARITHDAVDHVKGWGALFVTDAARLDQKVREIVRQRGEQRRIATHRHLTRSGDDYERQLLTRLTKAEGHQLLAQSAVAITVADPMAWKWEPGDREQPLKINRAPLPGEEVTPVGTPLWENEGVDRLVRRCYPVFGQVRALRVWDVLTAKGDNATDFYSDLVTQAGPLTAIDSHEQQRGVAIRPKPDAVYLAKWEHAEGTRSDAAITLASDVRSQLADKAFVWEDPHVLLATRALHRIKLPALSCLPRLREPYWTLLRGEKSLDGVSGRLPLHLFPAEQAAAMVEAEADSLLHQQFSIPPALIRLFDQEDDLRRFAHAIVFGVLDRRLDRDADEFHWVADLELDGQQEVVRFGETAVRACESFCTPDGARMKLARASLISSTEKQTNDLSDTDYADKLHTASLTSVLPEHELADDTGLIRALDASLRLLLRRAAKKAAQA